MAAQRRLLYVDGLNLCDNFFTEAIRSKSWDLERALQRVREFVAAAKASNIVIKIFIDNGFESHEAEGKWVQRRNREVSQGYKNMPHGLHTLLGDMFETQGCEVFYSCDADCDDTLASYAAADGADILSQDNDFFRYVGAPYSVFSGFRIEKGALRLTPHTGGSSKQRNKSALQLRVPPPACVAPGVVPFLTTLLRLHLYRRGTPTPLVRALGRNPHATARPLRRALYARVLPPSAASIREVFPTWDSTRGCVEWTDEQVAPFSQSADAADHRKWTALLLGPPSAAFAELFPLEKAGVAPAGIAPSDWAKHVFATYAVVCELCCAATGASLLESMQAVAAR